MCTDLCQATCSKPYASSCSQNCHLHSPTFPHRHLLRPQSPGRATPASPSFVGRVSGEGGTGVGFRLPAVMEGGSDGRSTPPLMPPALAPLAQRRRWLQTTPALLALGLCILALQV